MVESVVQREEEDRTGSTFLRLPKHIRQMGSNGNCPEIYIEDYAEGFLKRLSGNDPSECHVAVLVGEFCKSEGKRYVFIRGALECEGVVSGHEVCFTSESFANIYERIKRFFPQYEAVGWFLSGPEYQIETDQRLVSVHRDWFGGRDRVLYRVDKAEKTAAFYLLEKDELKKWPGYCIYFDKNEEMQEYMIAKKPNSVDSNFRDSVMEEIRRRVGGDTFEDESTEEKEREQRKASETETKKETTPGKEAGSQGTQQEGGTQRVTVTEPEKRPEPTNSRFSSAVIAVAVLFVIGALMYRNRDLLGFSKETPTGIPTKGAEALTDSVKEVLSAEASSSQLSEDRISPSPPALSMEDFTPINEPVYLPGSEDSFVEETKKPDEGKKVTAKPTLTPTTKPEKTGEAVVPPLELYIVKEGDTLAGICRWYYGDVSRIEEVKGLNQIRNEDYILVGQEIYLP